MAYGYLLNYRLDTGATESITLMFYFHLSNWNTGIEIDPQSLWQGKC